MTLAVADLIEQSIAPLALKDGAKLVLAYSGGVDSAVLCHGLAQYAQAQPQFQYLLVHVHHGLNPAADSWVAHCHQQALQYQLPFKCQRVTLTLGARISTEAAARDARYGVFTELVNPGDVLLTAHHQDDQLETVLLALKRGLGPKGLAAMGQVQTFAQQAWLVRPLLSVSREQIEAAAKQHQIGHIEDDSNHDTQYDRNFLRHEIIPRLKERWSAISVTSSRSAALCAQQQTLLDEVVSERLPALIEHNAALGKPCMDLSLLAKHSEHWQAVYLRAFIEACGFNPPSQAQLQNLLLQVLHAKSDAQINIVLNGLLAKRYQQRLYLLEAKHYQQPLSVDSGVIFDVNEHKTQQQIAVSDGSCIRIHRLENTSGLKLPNSTQQVSIQFGAPGSTVVHPSTRQKSRELKKVWQEFAVPPWERSRVPLVYFDDKLVCAVGYWIEKAYLSRKGEPSIQLQYHQ
ncbi:tRNA lysidine(34) synthetase TilS [Shewanella waksmanii]|uniref:tRNA lysidine(34) synthetase TilS n=1 Tax=Shewanella waksmanii TaxID=213783 RepID=UPI00048B93B7|nr:tRNA lysidine(34) synthetase TilS [Shewanella waksmanii]